MGAGAGAEPREAGWGPATGWGCGTRPLKAAGGALGVVSVPCATWAASAGGAEIPWFPWPDSEGPGWPGPARGVAALGGAGLPVSEMPRLASASGGRRGGGGLPAGVLVGGRRRAGFAPEAPVAVRPWVAAGATGGGGFPVAPVVGAEAGVAVAVAGSCAGGSASGSAAATGARAGGGPGAMIWARDGVSSPLGPASVVVATQSGWWPPWWRLDWWPPSWGGGGASSRPWRFGASPVRALGGAAPGCLLAGGTKLGRPCPLGR